MRTNKNTAAARAAEIMIMNTMTGEDQVRAAGATRGDVRPAAEGALIRWIGSGCVVLPAKADVLIMKEEEIMDMTNAEADPAAAVRVLPAEAVIPVGPAIPVVSSPAAAEDQVMAVAQAAVAVQAAAAQAAAAVPAGGKTYDFFHKHKHFLKSLCHETNIYCPPQQRTKIQEY